MHPRPALICSLFTLEILNNPELVGTLAEMPFVEAYPELLRLSEQSDRDSTLTMQSLNHK